MTNLGLTTILKARTFQCWCLVHEWGYCDGLTLALDVPGLIFVLLFLPVLHCSEFGFGIGLVCSYTRDRCTLPLIDDAISKQFAAERAAVKAIEDAKAAAQKAEDEGIANEFHTQDLPVPMLLWCFTVLTAHALTRLAMSTARAAGRFGTASPTKHQQFSPVKAGSSGLPYGRGSFGKKPASDKRRLKGDHFLLWVLCESRFRWSKRSFDFVV